MMQKMEMWIRAERRKGGVLGRRDGGAGSARASTKGLI
jgi:hypothetical protein